MSVYSSRNDASLKLFNFGRPVVEKALKIALEIPLKVLSVVLKQSILLRLLANWKLLSLSGVAIQQITSTL